VALSAVLDPRARRGVRRQLAVILGIGVCAMLTGARSSFTAIAEWARDLTPAVRSRLGIGRAIPSESVIRRTLQQVDPDALDRTVSGCLAATVKDVLQSAARTHPGSARRVVRRGVLPRHRPRRRALQR